MEVNSNQVVVTDIKIPFWSLVVLLVKWALAAIPAVFILIVLGAVASMLLNVLTGGSFTWHWGAGQMM